MTIGTEHEYSINDTHFTALPVSDQILKSICGSFESEILFGDVKLGKELQKTVLEFIPRAPASGPAELESMLTQGIRKFYQVFPGHYHLLGLGMHPTRRPAGDSGLGPRRGGVLRGLRPAVQYPGARLAQHPGAPGQPFVRGRKKPAHAVQPDPYPAPVPHRAHGILAHGGRTPDRENGQPAPSITGRTRRRFRRSATVSYRRGSGRSRSTARHRSRSSQRLRARDAGILCEEWLNSSGLIIRFSRAALRSRPRTNRNASAPIWRSRHW